MFELYAEFGALVIENARKTLLAVIEPSQRIFALYLLTSVVIAFFIYRAARARGAETEASFARFLFPARVWRHPSAWLDLRYFLFNKLIAGAFIVALSAWATGLAYRMVAGVVPVTDLAGQGDMAAGAGIAIVIGFMIASMVVSDFLGWFCHYLQHKSPVLWQFHKVHHSAEVMHPVSNFREHPFDNFLYVSLIGAGYGLCLGLAVRWFGYAPSVPTILGVPLLMLAFNIAGYNLRHSHIWLRWPGKLSMIFPSPAHHHVHHSCHPDHLDKNFAFMLPIWDVIFGTYHMPEDDRDVKFGIGDGNAVELTSCTRLYWVPVRDAFRVMKAQALGRRFNMSKPEPVASDPGPATIHPAE
jgi:sterol desaturase/sphingolipid hydroxylase (fatty acid hydroxylase superfamily)